jgi:chromosomal replication initiator protein
MVHLAAPGFSSRQRLIERFADESRLKLSTEVCRWLVKQPLQSIRQIRSATDQLASMTRASSHSLEVRDIHERLGVPELAFDVNRVIERVAEHFSVSAREMRGPDRHPRFMLPRHVSMYLVGQCTDWSAARIGMCFGKRDASSVRHALRKVERLLAVDASLAATVRTLREEIVRTAGGENRSDGDPKDVGDSQ